MHKFDTNSVINAIRTVVGTDQYVPLHEPEFGDTELELVKDCLDTGWVSTAGKYVAQFEQQLQEVLGAEHAVAVTNGTSALHLCLIASGVESGDEVIMPALGFVATANAISYCGAVPHFVDCDENNLGMSASALAQRLEMVTTLRHGKCFNRETNRPITAIIVVHLFGHPAMMSELLEVAEKYNLPVIEDAAEALGSRYKGAAAGTLGITAALSFNGNKIITTGGGGAVITNDKVIADSVRHLSTTARLPHPWHYRHDQVGYNYRLPNLNAALGCAQLHRLQQFLEEKRALANAYRTAFEGITGVKFFQEPKHTGSNYWLNAFILDREFEGERDDILEATNRVGILTRPAWTPLHLNEPFTDCPRSDLDQTESTFSRLINLPSSAKLGRRYVNAEVFS